MREVDQHTQRRRGCIYCADHALVYGKGCRIVCKYDANCPYHEMDGYHSYTEYLRKQKPDSLKWIFRRMFDLSDTLKP